MASQKRKVGIFFAVENKLFATELDYKSKSQFEKLISEYTINAEICDPNDNEQIKFVSIENILNSAYNKLPKKQRINKLLLNLMAQNSANNTTTLKN